MQLSSTRASQELMERREDLDHQESKDSLVYQGHRDQREHKGKV